MSNVLVYDSYLIKSNDDSVTVVAVAPVTMTLPAITTVAESRHILIADGSNAAATNNITIGASDGTLINGAASTTVLAVNNGTVTIKKFNGGWVATNVNAMQGPTLSVTDKTLARFNGVSGKAVQATNILVSDLDAMSGQKLAQVANVNITTGYALLSTDCGKMVEMTLSVSRALTLPNSFPTGWHCSTLQKAAGQIVYTVAGGATLTSNAGITTSKSVWARGTLFVTSNASGTAALWVLNGDVGP